MRTLLVLSGGGLPGIDVHTGVCLALDQMGIYPEEIHGTSAGAVAGAAWAAFDFSGTRLAALVKALSDDDIREEKPLWRLRMSKMDSFMRRRKIDRLLESIVPIGFNSLPCRFVAHASCLGKHARLDHGILWQAIAASISIRGVWDTVRIDGKEYSDGGTYANVPLPDHWREFDRVIISVATQPLQYDVRGVFSNALLSVHEMMENQVTAVLERVASDIGGRVAFLRPHTQNDSGMLRFNHGLIETARNRSVEYLATYID